MKPFEELNIWKEAQELALTIYEIFKVNKDFVFKDQIQRAAISISNNIAEGSENNSDRIMIRHLRIAKGSCGEVRSMLYLCPRLGYCSEETAMAIINRCRALSQSIGAFISYLKKNDSINP